MNDFDYKYICDMVRNESAIVLGEGKEYLVQARMQALVSREKLGSIDDLVSGLRKDPSGALSRKVVHAMTTNETSFFRDSHPFESLRKHVIPEIMDRKSGQRKINIWCAAASTGQEPFSIMMIIHEYFPELLNWDLYFLATDLSTDVLDRARDGLYNQFEVNRGLPASMLVKYFSKDGNGWRINSDIRDRIDFREMNLVQRWPAIPRFDLIFIRNVLIYFDMETKLGILRKIKSHLDPATGYVAFGAAESVLNVTDHFSRVTFDRSTYYRNAA